MTQRRTRPSPPLDHAWIAARIPHSGAMCLLDAVVAWDDAHIQCVATSHRDPGNPLRANGRLGAACGIEYAAQAMAVHGALLAEAHEHESRLGRECGHGTEHEHDHANGNGSEQNCPECAGHTCPRAGFLAGLRNVEAHVDRLDTFDAPLVIEAERMSGDGNTILYGFTLRYDTRVLLTGRAVVMLDASGALPVTIQDGLAPA